MWSCRRRSPSASSWLRRWRSRSRRYSLRSLFLLMSVRVLQAAVQVYFPGRILSGSNVASGSKVRRRDKDEHVHAQSGPRWHRRNPNQPNEKLHLPFLVFWAFPGAKIDHQRIQSDEIVLDMSYDFVDRIFQLFGIVLGEKSKVSIYRAERTRVDEAASLSCVTAAVRFLSAKKRTER